MASLWEQIAAELGGEVVPGTPAPDSAQPAPTQPPQPVDLQALAAELGGEIVPYQVPPEEPGFIDRVKESITGEQRRTQATETLPDWVSMPEMNDPSWSSFMASLGTMTTDPQETASIIKSQFPSVNLAQDEKGNFLMQSGMDGQWYAIKPGFRVSDIPRAAAGLLAFTPAGRATTIPRAIGANAATQAAIEGTQEAAGGDFDPAAVGLAGAAGGAGQILARAVPAGVAQLKQWVKGGGQAVPEGAVASPAAVVDDVAQAVPENAPQTTPASPAAVPEPVIEAPTGRPAVEGMNATDRAQLTDVITLARKASGNGMGAASARQRLIEQARIDPESRAAAESLGLELPFDVFSDNTALKAAVGLTRSEVASAAEESWRKSVSQASDQADEVLKQFDAAFLDDTVAPAVAADKVKESLLSTKVKLEIEAEKQFEEIAKKIGRSVEIPMPRLAATLAQLKQELKPGGLSKYEKRLDDMLSEGTTYARLQREKNVVGEALNAKGSAFSDMDVSALKRLYGALADDQLSAARRIGGEELRKQLKAANMLVEQRKNLEKRMVNLFGQDLEGSIANKMRTALTGAAKGDTADFNRLYRTVPPELRKETMATALASVVRAGRGAEKGNFGFSEFATLYPKLRANPKIYARLVEALGPESHDALHKLWLVSKRVTEARANVLGTGKSNQILRQSMNADGLIQSVLQNMAASRAQAAANMVGMDALGNKIAGAITNSSDDALRKMGDLFADQKFQLLAIEAAIKAQPDPSLIRQVATSKAFTDFLKAIKKPMTLDERMQALNAGLQVGNNLNNPEQEAP